MAVYCYSLTIAYQHTRVLLECHGLLSTETATARPVFERVFREDGLPAAIRTAFCSRRSRSTGSRTSTWWMRLGIVRQRIHPGSPQENRAYERMHRTLKAEATRPPKGNLSAQQRAFGAFRQEYNHERPHAALAGDPPASQYIHSRREYPERLAPIEYPGHFLVKRVTNAGTIRFKDRLLFLANALKQHHVGLEETGDGIWSLYLGPVLLGKIDERVMKVYE